MTLNERRDQLIRHRCPLLGDAEVIEAGEAFDRYLAFVVALDNRLRPKESSTDKVAQP